MKYKNIPSAMHNFGHSFLSLMNYCDEFYVVDILDDYFAQGKLKEVSIDFSEGKVAPIVGGYNLEILNKSIKYYVEWLSKHLSNHNIDADKVTNIVLKITKYKIGYTQEISCLDDKGKKYNISFGR